jgi:hypothetical protein
MSIQRNTRICFSPLKNREQHVEKQDSRGSCVAYVA